MELYVIASLGFCAIAALMYFATKSARHRQAPAFSPGPKNNKEVVVQGWTESDLKRILAHFEKLYEGQLGPAYSVTLKKVAESIRLSFPYDIPAEKFGFLVNYIHYPEGFDLKGRMIAASGTTTLSEAFAVPEESLVGQKALFYVHRMIKRTTWSTLASVRRLSRFPSHRSDGSPCPILAYLLEFDSEMKNRPNKTPEPTTFAVTSRAVVGVIEMKLQNPSRDAARAAPAKVVAHL